MNAKQEAQQRLSSLPDNCSHQDIIRAFGISLEGYRQSTTLTQTQEYFRLEGHPSMLNPTLHRPPSGSEAYEAWRDIVKI